VPENLFNFPYYFFIQKDLKIESKIKKLYLLIKFNVLIGLIKTLNKDAFCSIINFLYRNENKIHYDKSEKKYYLLTLEKQIYFHNKFTILGALINHEYELLKLLDSYNLNNFEIEENDLVVDCGANIGSFYFGLNMFLDESKYKYIGFEPDKKIFECLSLNIEKNENREIYNIGLSSKNNSKSILYSSPDSADSSMEKMDSDEIYYIESRTLDSFKLENIKLLKIDAEGHELDVLKGSIATLKNIEYITIDVGGEKGNNKENTLPDSTNFLLTNKFEIIKFNENRSTLLFKNKKY